MADVFKKYPPNYKAIVAAIPAVKKNKNIVFAYKGALYNPAANYLDPAFIAHELTHIERQGDKSDEWWEQYMSDVKFRLEEELAAYRVQWEYAVEFYDRRSRRLTLAHCAKDLSGPMYGNLITRQRAEELIKNKELQI
jgi:hypothetical protein